MRQFNIPQELQSLSNQRTRFNALKMKAAENLEKLHLAFSQEEIGCEPSVLGIGIFEFTFYGVLFFVKTEIAIDSTAGVRDCEMNIYTTLKDEDELVLSYSFDAIGNIGDGYTSDNFSKCYYVDFYGKVITFFQEKEIKFSLK